MSDKIEDYRAALGARISIAVKQIGKKSEAAAEAGISVEQLKKWTEGTVKVPAEGLLRLATAANIDFSWLCSGQETSTSLQPDILREVLRGIIRIMQKENLQFIDPDKFPELVFVLHDYVRDEREKNNTVDLDAMSNIIMLSTRRR